jgi:chromosome segregation ATPase
LTCKQDTVRELQEAHEELIKIEILHLEATSDLATLRQRHSDSAAMLEEKNTQIRNKINEIKDMAARGRELQKKARVVYRTAGEQPDAGAVLESLSDHDLNRLNADIDSEKARLELTHGGDSNTIREFEEREKQIGKLHDKLSQFQTKLSEIDTAIVEIRRDWEPRLDALIQKISDAFADSFARIGCAGQVSLDKVQAEPGPNGEPGGHDFDQWSIQIHVKFRDHENLSLLNSHRQSGGERAVSTIFYLMALQSLSASPFRVVDEINQGMDPRNERMVHGRLVDIACDSESEDGSGGGQYFLITPKLLSGLAYKPGMRVLCIYSGEHMPKDYSQLDFKLAIRNMKAIREKSGQSTGAGQAVASSSRVDVYA